MGKRIVPHLRPAIAENCSPDITGMIGIKRIVFKDGGQGAIVLNFNSTTGTCNISREKVSANSASLVLRLDHRNGSPAYRRLIAKERVIFNQIGDHTIKCDRSAAP